MSVRVTVGVIKILGLTAARSNAALVKRSCGGWERAGGLR